MSYQIPSDDQVKSAIEKILKKFRTINSQYKLKELVTKELDTKKEKFGVSNSRLRFIAINSDFVKLEIHSREGDPKKLMIKCPVCGSSLKRVKNLTIWGGEVTIEFRCNKCGYWTGKKKRIPTRYVFHLKKKKS
jgi:transposase-like protein